MRAIITAVCILTILLLPFYSTGQYVYPRDSATGKIAYSKIIKCEGLTAEQLFEKSQKYLQSDPENFYINDKTIARSRGMSRAVWGNDGKDIKLGYASDNQGKKELRGRCMMAYGGLYYECVMYMVLKADLLIQCKDNRVRATLTNFRYEHYSNIIPPRFMPIKAHGEELEESGKLEDLLEFGLCEDSQKFFDEFIDNSAKQFLKDYRDDIKPIDAKGGDNW